jgi:hypothetical protein
VPDEGNRVEPRARPIRGGFLALSPEGVWPRIGVRGDTEDEARQGFMRSFRDCEVLLEGARTRANLAQPVAGT